MAILIKKFCEIGINDVAEVGGKNASLGEMYSTLGRHGINVPDGFATTAGAFKEFIYHNDLRSSLDSLIEKLDTTSFNNLEEIGKQARDLILQGNLQTNLVADIESAYSNLGKGQPISVAVRSSATAEDLPEASFAGQHESYLNISGSSELIAAVKKCFASLYTDRAIKYRIDNGFDHRKIALSVGVQLMVRSDKSCSGVMFTLEPESGFRNVVHIAGCWGLGENIVQGTVTPDEFLVFKPTLMEGKDAILMKRLGTKSKMMVYNTDIKVEAQVINTNTPAKLQNQFVINDDEISHLAMCGITIENHYKKPMDIEWAKDGNSDLIYIVQARPETVRSRESILKVKEYRLKEKGNILATGEAIGSKIAAGTAHVLKSAKDSKNIKLGDIIVTELTSPDWDPILELAGGLITDKGGRTSHAAIIAREIGIPAVIGSGDATSKIADGQQVTIDCSQGKQGFVYDGKLKFGQEDISFAEIQKPKRTKAMMILSDPDKAFKYSFYPNDGVGLVRIEFIITHAIQAHPMALANYPELKDKELKNFIDTLTTGYTDKKKFFVDKLAAGVGMIAAAFYPKDVIVRMSDFKSNEYSQLIGGELYEPLEENPMIGFRGASRYYNPRYKAGFALECAAMKKVRDEMGLTNVKLMIPFCRTVDEGKKVLDTMAEFGLNQGANGLEIYVMAEIPSNVMQAEDFAAIFDGFSIGSNDLTQLTLGIDRDSALVADLFSEQNKSAKMMIGNMVTKAKAVGAKIGLCGQAPSDIPEFAQFLVDLGIDSISFNPDALLHGIENINKAERVMLESVI